MRIANPAVPRRPLREFRFAPLIVVGVPVVLWFAPLGVADAPHRTLAITLFVVLAWITQVLDHAVTGLIGCYLYWAVGGVSFPTAFGGFAESTTWFAFGALLFGAIGRNSGFAHRVAGLVLRAVGASYPRLLLGVILCDFLLTFLVPAAVARIVILAPILLGVAEAFGAGPRSNIARAMFIVVAYSADLFDKMLMTGLASITARGLIERFGHVEVLWSRWVLAFLPCDAITIVVAWRLALRLFPPERADLPAAGLTLIDRFGGGAWTRVEKKAAGFLLAALALWATDFLHHLSPALICLGVALAATVPRIGVLQSDDWRRIDYLPVLFIGSSLSVGQVLQSSGALDLLTRALLGWVGPHVGTLAESTAALYWTAFSDLIVAGSGIAMLATSVPVLMNLASLHGLNPLAVGMIWTFGSGGKLFVYQSSAFIVAYSYGCFDARDLMRLGIRLAIIESAVLLVVVAFYWPLIGIT